MLLSSIYYFHLFYILRMKFIFKIISLILVVLLLVYYAYSYFFSTTHIAEIINKNKKHYSIILAENDNLLININAEELRPLASIVKLIIAVEFAEQVANKTINESTLVSIKDLESYHVPNTDGNAHKDWLKHIRESNKIVNLDSISLLEIAKGMITYSSNANTEYLLDKLGIDNVNIQLKKLGFKTHSKISYPVSDMYLTSEELGNDSRENLYHKSNLTHQKLKSGELLSENFDSDVDFTKAKQKLLNDRLSQSTAHEYYKLMIKFRDKNYFKKDVQDILYKIIERRATSEEYDIIRYCSKGGSTSWVLNNVVYLERKNGKMYVLILFSNYPTNDNDNFLISKTMGKLINEITVGTNRSEKLINIINE